MEKVVFSLSPMEKEIPKGQSVCEEHNYAQLYDEHAVSLRNFIFYRCGDLSKAEDMMHDAFVTMWRNCKTILLEKAKSYLFTVGNRLFLNDYQHQKVALKFEKDVSYLDNAVSPEFLLEEKEFKNRLELAISHLSEGQREVFLLNRIDKKTYTEIADLLDLSVKAVEKRMHQALKALKQKVEELEQFKI